MDEKTNKDKIIIVDFGSQVTKLIARRIRDHGVYSEIITLKELEKTKAFDDIKGIILSGGPDTVTKKTFPNIPLSIFSLKIPVLGICYGLQVMAKKLGGKVLAGTKKREFGRAKIFKVKNSILTENFYKKKRSFVWMSHQDVVYKLPKGFRKIASTKDSSLTIIENKNKKFYGVQFHPEVTHTENGKILLKNFIFKICKSKKTWKINSEKNRIVKKI